MGHNISTCISLSSILGYEEICTRKKKQRKFSDYYEYLHDLGSGSMGTVSCIKLKMSTIQKWASICCHMDRKINKKKKKIFPANSFMSNTDYMQLYAVKKVKNCNKYNQKYLNEIKNELSILKTLDHINIVHIHDLFEKENKISLVIQLCTGGDLSARCPCKSEKHAASILKMIVSAVAHMHLNGIIHRDLKFENIMFEDCTPNSEIKIIDFGLSTTFKPEEVLTKRVGTPYTMAPEVLNCNYTSKADLWSIGVITYILLTNHSPFDQTHIKILLKEITSCTYNFKHPIWIDISNEAKNFISNLLVADPEKRMDANEALQHPWLTKFNKKKESKINNNVYYSSNSMDLMYILYHNIASYSKYNYFKKAALMVMAHKQKSPNFPNRKNDIILIRKLFRKINVSQNGCVTFKEFKLSFFPFNESLDELSDMFKAVDFNNSGTITYTELLATSLECFNCLDQISIIDVFDRFDIDCNGYITLNKVDIFLQSYFNIKEKKECVIDLLSTDRDVASKGYGKTQKITLKEFMTYFQ